jgi:hypothetical protein
MSKRMVALKKMMILVSMGGATFCLPWLCGDGLGFACAPEPTVRNADLTEFYQGVGDAAIENFRDGTAADIQLLLGAQAGTDFETVVINPVAGFFTNLWDNWVDRQIPLDPGQNAIWRE